MTVNYTSLLSLGQPVTGTESGTWGDDVNNAVTSYLDIAIAGTLTLTGDGSVTLSNTQGTNTATNIGSTTAQYAVLKVVGPLTATKVITAPSASKTYVVLNTDSTYGVTIKASGQSGVTVAANSRATVAFNGTDYVVVATGSVSNLSGLGTGVATALAVNTGSSGAFVVNGGALGTPSSGTLTNATGLPISTGVSGLGANVATALGTAVGATGAFVVNGGALGTPSSGTLTNATGLPISTGVSGLGTGVATALAVNTGSAGAFVVNGGAGAFTTLSASGVATFSAGTAAAPAITTTGDTNNGIFFPGTDIIAITTAGTERFRVTSTGNVGIGTSNPLNTLSITIPDIITTGVQIDGKLTTNQSSDFLISRTGTVGTAVGQGANFQLYNANGKSVLLQGAGDRLQIFTNDSATWTEQMSVYGNGNVVVGTAALGTTATAGFMWIPSCAGAPTGAPTAPYSNAAALVADTTNNRLYVRVGSTWRYASLT